MCEVSELLLTYVPFCENTWHIGFHKVRQKAAQGCHYELKGWFLLQVSDGASVRRVTLFYGVTKAIRMSYLWFEHFVSTFKVIHGVFRPLRC